MKNIAARNMSRQTCLKYGLALCLAFAAMTGVIRMAFALEGLALLQAGFTIADPFEEPPTEFITQIKANELGENPLFFWSKIACQTEECKSRLASGEIQLIHRWIRMYGTKLNTQQQHEFLPDEYQDNAVRSLQKITSAGRWFVEVSASDGEVLCQDKTCKFYIGIQ